MIPEKISIPYVHSLIHSLTYAFDKHVLKTSVRHYLDFLDISITISYDLDDTSITTSKAIDT